MELIELTKEELSSVEAAQLEAADKEDFEAAHLLSNKIDSIAETLKEKEGELKQLVEEAQKLADSRGKLREEVRNCEERSDELVM